MPLPPISVEKRIEGVPESPAISPPRGETISAEQVAWDDAPLGVTLWGVYGPDCFPTIFPCRLNKPWAGRALWGFSIYQRSPSFRTLGVGKDWADKHDLRLFRTRIAAFAYITKLFAEAEGA